MAGIQSQLRRSFDIFNEENDPEAELGRDRPNTTSSQQPEHPDSRLLQEYKWSVYNDLPNNFKALFASALLQEIYRNAALSITQEACAQLLQSQPELSALLLHCWECGSFEELRESDTFKYEAQAIKITTTATDNAFIQKNAYSTHENAVAQTLAVKPSASGSQPVEGHNMENQDGKAQDLNGENTILHKQVEKLLSAEPRNIQVNNSTFTEIAGDHWEINYYGSHTDKTAEWLSHTNQRNTHNEIVLATRRASTSGAWFYHSKILKSWFANPYHRILWCPGIPGVGKTVMASIAVDYLRKQCHLSGFVACIYFNYKLQKVQNLKYALEQLSRQAHETCQARGQESPFNHVHGTHSEYQSRPTTTELRSALHTALSKFDKSFIVIDALDEYLEDYNDEDITQLFNCLMQLPQHVKVLVTSRDIGNMSSIFQELNASKLEVQADPEDIRDYVGRELVTLRKHINISEALADQVIAKVEEAAQGRFLMVSLHMKSLTECLNPGSLQDALNQLSTSIDETYVKIMKNIQEYSPEKKELAMKALMWIAFSQRKLTTKELQHALATVPGRLNVSDYVTQMSTITALCAGLVVVSEKEELSGHRVKETVEYVSFIHFTAQEFFNKSQATYFASSHIDMSETCLAYLSRPGHIQPHDFSYGECYSDPYVSHRDWKQIHPFYDYAVTNLCHHKKGQMHTISKQLESFLQGDLSALEACLMHVLQVTPWLSDWWSFNASSATKDWQHVSAYLSIYFDQDIALRTALKSKPSICHSAYPIPFLVYTALLSKTKCVKLLLENCLCCIHPSQNRGHSLAAGITFPCIANARGPDGSAVLHCRIESSNIVLALLDHPGIEADSKDINGRTPLSYGAEWGHEAIVTLLLAQPGVEVDSGDDDGRTPLSHAAEWGHEATVTLLLAQPGVEADSKDNDGCTPLSYAARWRNEAIVKLLLAQQGVEADSKDKNGRTPLSYAAAQWGCQATVTFLLAHPGVEADSKDNNGRTPLSYAMEQGDHAIVKLLLQAQPDVEADSKDNNGCTPLFYAAISGHEAIATLLLAQPSVEANSKDNNGCTPLFYAASSGHEAIATLLLAQPSVEANSKDNNGFTPLIYAAERGHKAIVTLLLAQPGVDADSKDNNGRTPLSYAAEWGHENVVALLLAQPGVEADSKDNDGWTPLSYAASLGHEAIVTLLLQAQPDVEANSKDSSIRSQTPSSFGVGM